jgi:adenylyltransferase/sulfurtransferase
MGLSKEQIARYARQLILPEIGVKGQERLQSASVLIIGAGGLGSPAALYLAAAGVGRLGIVDRETLEISNLHRQILHLSADIGRAKSESARIRLNALNPEVRIEAIQENLDELNTLRVMQAYDLVLDGSDNFPTHYLVNDACILLGKPLVHAGAIEMRGQLMSIMPRASACVRCVFPEPPSFGAIPSCQEGGVLGSAVGVIGSLMAHEALKILLGWGELLTNRLLIFDGKSSRFREVALRRDPSCAVCGGSPSITALRVISEETCV